MLADRCHCPPWELLAQGPTWRKLARAVVWAETGARADLRARTAAKANNDPRR